MEREELIEAVRAHVRRVATEAFAEALKPDEPVRSSVPAVDLLAETMLPGRLFQNMNYPLLGYLCPIQPLPAHWRSIQVPDEPLLVLPFRMDAPDDRVAAIARVLGATAIACVTQLRALDHPRQGFVVVVAVGVLGDESARAALYSSTGDRVRVISDHDPEYKLPPAGEDLRRYLDEAWATSNTMQ